MKVVGQSRRPASPASEVAEAGTILVGSAVHCDGCQHKRVTKTLHFTPFQEVRRGLSCSKQHQLIIDGREGGDIHDGIEFSPSTLPSATASRESALRHTAG